MKNGKSQHITAAQRAAFRAVTHAATEDPRGIALMACFVNGEPSTVICHVEHEDKMVNITPLFVAVTPGMKLVDYDGQAPNARHQNHEASSDDPAPTAKDA